MAVMLVGMVLGYLANTRADVWRRRFEAERAFYADYRHRAEEQLARPAMRGFAAEQQHLLFAGLRRAIATGRVDQEVGHVGVDR
ncbi:MAG: hypothetical protein K2P79_10625, partial [Sphingomonas sp.]|nr:hypothetical protein [Sphingomonas sp.]